MAENNNHSREKEFLDVVPFRVDLKSRICLMAAFIYGAADPQAMTVNQAIDKAVEIENAADAKVRKMKRENPIPRKN